MPGVDKPVVILFIVIEKWLVGGLTAAASSSPSRRAEG